MSIRAAIHHLTHYIYDRPVSLGPQIIRLRPAPHSRTRVISHSLKVTPTDHFVNHQQDPYGNWLARYVFPEMVRELKIEVEAPAPPHMLETLAACGFAGDPPRTGIAVNGAGAAL